MIFALDLHTEQDIAEFLILTFVILAFLVIPVYYLRKR